MRNFIICLMLALSVPAWSAAVPQGSRWDSRMQQTYYNVQNSTVINTRAGYVSTLVFSDDEAVIDTQVGFIKGWQVDKNANRVYIRPVPITQPVTGADGTNASQVFLPESKDWKTNLFVTTSRHFYSMELNVLDETAPAKNQAFVVTWQYPEDTRKASEAATLARQKEWSAAQEKSRIEKAFTASTAPRNWDYFMRVKTGSNVIAPDFAYDDGRFTYLGFSPLKKIPSPYVIVNGKEQLTAPPQVKQQKNYRVMVIPSLSEKIVLRYGDAVIGLVNQGFGKVAVSNSSTVSPAVTVEAKQ